MSGMFGRALPPLPPGEKPKVPPPVVQHVHTTISVDFFLPTGIMVSMKVDTTNTLRELKDSLFSEAKSYPLFKLLKDQSFYNFLGKRVK